MTAIINATLVMRDHLIPGGVLLMEDGKITDFRGTFEEYRAMQARKAQAAPVQKTAPEPRRVRTASRHQEENAGLPRHAPCRAPFP